MESKDLIYDIFVNIYLIMDPYTIVEIKYVCVDNICIDFKLK